MTEHEEEKKLTPAQLAEIEEGKKSMLERFEEVVADAEHREKHGMSVNPAFVAKLKALHDEAKSHG